MRKLLAISVPAAATLLGAVTFSAAQDKLSVEETYKDIEATFGVVPSHMKTYPKSAVAGAWAMTNLFFILLNLAHIVRLVLIRCRKTGM